MRGLEGVKVSDTLYQFSVNARSRDPEERRMGRPMVVTKVGRKLVTVEEYGRPFQYRIETGQANDQYGHEWLVTEAERDAGLRVSEARAFLRSLGLRLGFRPSDERLVEIAERLKDLEPER